MNKNSHRARLLTFDAVAPVVRESRVAAWTAAAWRYLIATVLHSAVADLMARFSATVRAIELSMRVRLVAWMVAVAATTNLVMLAVVERYHFPRRTALVLPAVVAIVALVASALSADIARALEEKKDK